MVTKFSQIRYEIPTMKEYLIGYANNEEEEIYMFERALEFLKDKKCKKITIRKVGD